MTWTPRISDAATLRFATAFSCVAIFLGLSVGADPSPENIAAPEEGDLAVCQDPDGPRTYIVAGVSPGDNFAFWRLDELGGEDVRVGWNSQLEAVHKATGWVIEQDWQENTIRTAQWADLDQTGPCGFYHNIVYNANCDCGHSWDLIVYFAGQNVQMSEAEGETASYETETIDERTWGISGKYTAHGGVVTAEYEESMTTRERKSFSSSAGSTTTHESFEQEGGQAGIVTTPS